MKVFVIFREDKNYSYGNNYKAVVVAKDAMHAERWARLKVWGWKNAKLEPPIEVDLNTQQIVSVENTGG